MKITILMVAFLSLSFVPVVGAETIKASSVIEKVTVYSDRAQVTRVATVTLKPGAQEIIFEGLPGAIEAQSISTSGRGKAKVKLYGAKIKVEQLAETQSEVRKNLQDQLEKLQDGRRILEGERQVLDQKQQFLSSIRSASLEQLGKDLVTKSPAPQDVKGIADYLEAELAGYYQKVTENNLKTRDLDKEINRVARELGQLGGGNAMQKTKIAVDLEAETAGDFEIELRYRVPGASWSPFYEARARVSESKVFWKQYANIWQNTGEDWKSAKLQLSTAEPALSGQMPETQPWMIRKFEPPAPIQRDMRRKNFMSARAEMGQEDKVVNSDAEAMPMVAAMAVAPPVEASYAIAGVQSKGASVEYELAKRETVLADGQPIKASIQALELPAGFRYQISPRLSNHAYLMAKVTNPTEGILLGGEVHLFQDDSFIGTSVIELVGPQETFDLSLGVDERIKVEHKTLRSKTDISLIPGLNGKWKTIEYAYLTKIENYYPATVEITILDQIPVSQHADIKIEKIEADPKWSEEEKDKPGVYKWHIKMNSKSKKEVKLGYKIKYPESFQVEGL